jgi:hypothetical protein
MIRFYFNLFANTTIQFQIQLLSVILYKLYIFILFYFILFLLLFFYIIIIIIILFLNFNSTHTPFDFNRVNDLDFLTLPWFGILEELFKKYITI